MCQLMESRGQRLAVDDSELLLRCWKRFCAATADMEGLHTPKRHAIGHMLCQTPLKGNPRFYALWHDESLNRVLKMACRRLCQSTFETTVWLSMPSLLRGPRP